MVYPSFLKACETCRTKKVVSEKCTGLSTNKKLRFTGEKSLALRVCLVVQDQVSSSNMHFKKTGLLVRTYHLLSNFLHCFFFTYDSTRAACTESCKVYENSMLLE